MDVNARNNYGSTLFVLGRYVDALNACDAAILTDETFSMAYINAAHCLAALDHMDQAAYALNSAFEQDTENAELGVRVAELLADIEEYDMARDVFFQVASLPDAPQDIHAKIAAFFADAKTKIDRTIVLKDVETWRGQFIKNPDVFRLAADLMR